MSGSTTRHAIPWPEGTDVPAGHTQMKAIADKVDEALPFVSSTTPPHVAGLMWFNPGTGRTQISDGTNWRELNPPPAATPAWRLVQSTAQSCGNGAWTALAMQTEDLDTDSWHAAGAAAVKPTVPGWYWATGVFAITNTTGGTRAAALYKNGIEVPASRAALDAGASIPYNLHTTALVFLNGSSDYLDVRGFQNSGGALDTVAGNSSFCGHFVRP